MGEQSGWQLAGLPMSAEDVQPILHVAKREAQALGQFLDHLALEDWNRPSGAAGWQIGDVVGHLVKVGQAYRAFIARGLTGETGGAGATQPWPGLPEIRTRLSNAAVAAREEFGSDLQQAFVDAWDRLFSDMQGLAPEDWARPFPFALSQQQPPGAIALWAMQELAIHSWDVRSACDPRAQLSPDHLPALLERLSLRYALPRFAEFPTLATDSGSMRCRFELSRDIENRSYDILVEDGRARLEPATEEAAQMVFRLSGSDFVLLFFQRQQAQALLDSGAMTAQGDMRLVTLFAHWLAGIEMP